MILGIIDYNVGNLNSVLRAFEKNGGQVKIIKDPKTLDEVDKIILPGVGSYKYGIEMLHKLGFFEAIRDQVLINKKPILGICLGMQLLSTSGTEDGKINGLNLIPGIVKIMNTGFEKLLVPHVGWNNLIDESSNIILEGINKMSDFYFVHSYEFILDDISECVAKVDYGPGVVAVVNKDNIYGVQFHPEKSHISGFKLIKNFIDL